MKNNSNELRTILFDKDGVFLNSEVINVASHVFAMKIQGILLNSQDKLDLYGKNGKDGAKILGERYGQKILETQGYNFDKEAYMMMKSSYYRKHLNKAEIFPEVVAFAKKLKNLGHRVAMVTSMGDKSTAESLKKLGLEDFFEVVVTSDQCKKRKPDKEPYETAMKLLEVNSKDCLVFEDSPVGITAAHDAGIECAVLKSTHVREEDISKANYMITNKQDLLNYDLLDLLERTHSVVDEKLTLGE